MFFVALFIRVRNQIENRQIELLEQRRLDFEHKLALQIAHDIRSPLSAINMALKSVTNIPADTREVILNASKRINNIANDLLQQHKKSGTTSISLRAFNLELTDLAELLAEIAREKNLSFDASTGIKVVTDIHHMENSQAFIDRTELSRALSNLINNSVEAMDTAGSIRVALRGSTSGLAIVIADEGRGIPEEILSRLGSESVSFGKETGSGLGIMHAKSTVELMGGKFSIQSKSGLGTIVTMAFSTAKRSVSL